MDFLEALLNLLRECSDFLVHYWHHVERLVTPLLLLSSVVFRNVPPAMLVMAFAAVVHNWLTATH